MQAYRGLLCVYSQRMNVDSIKKYMNLYEISMNNFLMNNQAKAVAKAYSMYDYSRHQRLAAESKYREERNQWALLITLFVAASLSFYSYRVFRSYKGSHEKTCGLCVDFCQSE